MPPSFSKAYFSGTECGIDLKPGCKFELVCYLLVYRKKLTNSDHLRTLAGPFRARVPRIQPRRVHLGVHLGVHEGPGGSLEPLQSSTMTKKVFQNGQRCTSLCTMQKWYMDPAIGSKIIRSILGALQGPLKDQDGSWTQQGSTFMSLESLDMFLLSRIQNYSKYGQFPLWGIFAPAPED